MYEFFKGPDSSAQCDIWHINNCCCIYGQKKACAKSKTKQAGYKAAFTLAVCFCLKKKKKLQPCRCLPSYRAFTQPRAVSCKCRHKAHNLVLKIRTFSHPVWSTVAQRKGRQWTMLFANSSFAKGWLFPSVSVTCWDHSATATPIPCCLYHSPLPRSNYDWRTVIRTG